MANPKKAELDKLVKLYATYIKFGEKVNVAKGQQMYDKFRDYLLKLKEKYPDHDSGSDLFWSTLEELAQKYISTHLMLGPGQTFGCKPKKKSKKKTVGYMAEFWKTDKPKTKKVEKKPEKKKDTQYNSILSRKTGFDVYDRDIKVNEVIDKNVAWSVEKSDSDKRYFERMAITIIEEQKRPKQLQTERFFILVVLSVNS